MTNSKWLLTWLRITGDLLHLSVILLLLYKLVRTRSTNQISWKTQLAYLLVFVFRYLDLFVYQCCLYLTVFKCIYLTLTLVTVVLVWRWNSAETRSEDHCKLHLLMVFCFCLALLINHDLGALELTWAFSIYLEAVAILPQLMLIANVSGCIDRTILIFLFGKSMYRFLYLIHWLHRYYMEEFYDAVAVLGALIQCAVYFDFFLRRWKKGPPVWYPQFLGNRPIDKPTTERPLVSSRHSSSGVAQV